MFKDLYFKITNFSETESKKLFLSRVQDREKDRDYFILQALYFLSNNNASLKWLDNI